jgi:hypothetical protein
LTQNPDSRATLGLLQASTGPLPAARSELTRIKREGLAGESLLEVLSNIYHLHGLNRAPKPDRDGPEGNEALPRIMCSEALIRH